LTITAPSKVLAPSAPLMKVPPASLFTMVPEPEMTPVVQNLAGEVGSGEGKIVIVWRLCFGQIVAVFLI